jgi:murein DD-endopeptidase MepM/ murein hydrolase activator NlpD
LVTSSAPRARPRSAGKLLTAGLAVAFAILPTSAGAAVSTGGAPTPAEAPPAPVSATGAPASGTPSSGALSLVSAKADPRKSYFDGIRSPSLRFELESTKAQNDIRIDVIDEAGEVVRSYYRNAVAPHRPIGIRWDGMTSEKHAAPKGRYTFRVSPQGASQTVGRASTSSEPLSLGFEFFVYEFPILGAHNYGGPDNRFGAPRSGHTHEGQDVLAACGTPLVAARGGTVRYAGYEGAAGNYLVIDGKGTPYDTVYMHLAQPSPLKTGDPVRTGQAIGIVGETGDATACHLHFELWTGPGWYVGGHPVDPLPYLKRWDQYS